VRGKVWGDKGDLGDKEKRGRGEGKTRRTRWNGESKNNKKPP